jgi:hypothetical protein
MNYIKICEIPEKVLLDQFEIEYSDFCMQQPTLGIYVGDEPFGWFNYADETWEYL